MKDYGFNRLNEQAGLFSYYPGRFKSFSELHETVHKVAVNWGQRDHQDRIDFCLLSDSNSPTVSVTTWRPIAPGWTLRI